MSKLIDVYPDWLEERTASHTEYGGVFQDLDALLYDSTLEEQRYPWLHDLAPELDMYYYGTWAGDKTVSPLIEKLVALNSEETNPDVLTVAQRQKIVKLIDGKCYYAWTKMWETWVYDYDPLENYNGTETRTPNLSTKHKVSDDFKQTVTNKADVDVTVASSTDAQTNKFGFNSSNSVPESDGYNETTQHTIADGDNNTNTQESTQDGYTEELATGTETVTKHGNLGQTTSQMMATQEMVFRELYNYFEIVFKNVDKILATPIYSLD